MSAASLNKVQGSSRGPRVKDGGNEETARDQGNAPLLLTFTLFRALFCHVLPHGHNYNSTPVAEALVDVDDPDGEVPIDSTGGGGGAVITVTLV